MSRANMAAPPPARLNIREFLHEVQERTERALDPALGSTTSKRMFTSLQIHFGEPRLHYEVWPVRKTGRIELGLHIEGPHDWSREVAAQIAGHADDLRAVLGPDWELEDWTASWSRLHTTFPLATLTEPVADDVAAATCRLIHGTEPVLRRLTLPPIGQATPRDGQDRRRWRRRRKG